MNGAAGPFSHSPRRTKSFLAARYRLPGHLCTVFPNDSVANNRIRHRSIDSDLVCSPFGPQHLLETIHSSANSVSRRPNADKIVRTVRPEERLEPVCQRPKGFTNSNSHMLIFERNSKNRNL